MNQAVSEQNPVVSNDMQTGELGKVPKEKKRVGTHHGKFHADEVMATAILMELFDLEVYRTRDPRVLEGLDLVYDVGGGEFDHHQLDKEVRENGIPYAACGLIWRRFGREVIASREPELSEENIERIFNHIDYALIEGIDALDNGVKQEEGDFRVANISAIISGFNPPWDSEEPEDEAFWKAVHFASAVLDNMLRQQFSSIRARDNVLKAFNERRIPQILELPRFFPWAGVLREIDVNEEVLFVIYPNQDGYFIQTVRKSDDSMEARKDLPKSWAGKRDEELNEIIGIPDAIFCHSGRFMAGAKSYESIMKMAQLALAEPPDSFIKRLFFRFKKVFQRAKP